MVSMAFKPYAFAGGLAGFSVMQAMTAGLNLSITATESGLGTAAILFGYTGSKDPVRSGVMGMVSTFISSIVCFIVAFCIVISGVWDSGLESAALTIASFSTVFGAAGGWIVSFLSISFGVGVLVAFAYITRAAWLALTNGRFEWVFGVLYCVFAFLGALVDVHVVWKAIQIINGLLLSINLLGLMCLMPHLIKEYRLYRGKREYTS
jgi:alanine or glycine:cation symporter, AGCS family